jgi:hypothetical protein
MTSAWGKPDLFGTDPVLQVLLTNLRVKYVFLSRTILQITYCPFIYKNASKSNNNSLIFRNEEGKVHAARSLQNYVRHLRIFRTHFV